MLRDELGKLPKGHLVFSLGMPKHDPLVGTSVPVTLQVDTDAFAPTTQWYAVRVNGRYYAARKVNAPVAAPAKPAARMTIVELRRALGSPTGRPESGDFVVIDGQYMGVDGDLDGAGDGHVWVGLVEDAAAQTIEFTLSCRDLTLPPNIEPGTKLTVSGVLRLDVHEPSNPSLDPCFAR